MYRNDSGVIRHQNAFRNEKFVNGPKRFPSAFLTRRPLLHPCGRPLGNWFPRQHFRPFTRRPLLHEPRIEHPYLNSNYQGPPNSFHAIPPHSEQCEFPRNNFRNCPPRMAVDAEMKTSNFGLINPPVFNHYEELWIETMSENGRMYYYNANSRITTWDKPQNVKIMNFWQLKAFAGLEYNNVQAENHAIANREDAFQSINGNLECVPSAQNLSTAPLGFVSFPPPTLYTPAPFFAYPPPATNFNMSQVTSNPPYDIHINAMSAPTALEDQTNIQSFDHVPQNGDAINPAIMDEQNQLSDAPQVIYQNIYSEQMQIILSSEAYSGKSESSMKNKKYIKCKDELSSVEIANEFPIYMDEGRSANNVSYDVECIQNVKIKIDGAETLSNLEEDDKLKRSCPDVHNMSEDVCLDKCRPVSSTPIPGSKWCVVRTGDSKIFFYDAYCKISVWKTPEELLHRTDVKKIIDSPPPAVSEEIDYSSSDAKKMKIEVESAPGVSEYPLNTSDEQPTIQEIVLKATKDREDIPHETRVQMFMNMLSEKKVSAFSTWEKELHKIVFDSRYLLLAPKERKHKFEAYVHTKIEEEKNRKKREITTIKENYTRLLEEAGVTHNTHFSHFAYKYSKDSRFQAIDKTKERERLFHIFIRNLHRTVSQNSTYSKQASQFLELLKELDFLNADSTWYECKKKIAADDRYLAVNSEEHRENLFRDFIRNYFSRSLSKGKEERIFDSIQTRRKEVQRNLSVCMKELEEERLLYKHDSLTNGFTALLIDLVRNPDMKYREAIRFLKADHRWDSVSGLRTNERERLFDDHIHQLKTRKKEHFHKLLDELLKDILLTSTWKDVKKIIQGDERCAHFFSDEKKCEKEFNDYMKNRLKTAKEDFRHLLKETKIITYASKNLLKNTNHLENIENALAKDKRYLVLECVENDRKKMILKHIENLYIQGPPPPPTATEPSRR